ncbi:hypothetical protein HPHPH45_1118 [Helicobacter pylori Hp H-45]|uniref:Uncharacterized protein n=1 Tax=Helicobacter pylori Hp H-45 TaxID=992050 RepID=J0LYD0_HELPX|nr:hypothetical protein HPHPH45_1118 [Helicobacter pylori Hp H-45]
MKNTKKRFLRLNTKELVVSQAEFLVRRSMNWGIFKEHCYKTPPNPLRKRIPP